MEKEGKIEVKINFMHNTKLKFPDEATLLDLKTQISKNFLIRENEYELFLGDISLSKISNKTSLNSLVNEYKSMNFYIKSYKNIFDLKKQLADYNEFLDKNIRMKEEEIEAFKKNLEELSKELVMVEENEKKAKSTSNSNAENLEGTPKESASK